jgi:hypothetical protein
MVKLAGSLPCSDVEVESDPWIPFKVTWLPRPPGRPLYLRVSGSQGGEVEIKVDAETGSLVQLIVLEEPPNVAETTDDGTTPVSENLVPVLDLGPWRADVEGESAPAGVDSHLKWMVADMKCWRGPGRMGIVFSAQEKSVVYSCGVARVAVSADGDLVEVVASHPE